MLFNCFQAYIGFGQVAVSSQGERRGCCKGGHLNRWKTTAEVWAGVVWNGRQLKVRRVLAYTSDHSEEEPVFAFINEWFGVLVLTFWCAIEIPMELVKNTSAWGSLCPSPLRRAQGSCHPSCRGQRGPRSQPLELLAVCVTELGHSAGMPEQDGSGDYFFKKCNPPVSS